MFDLFVGVNALRDGQNYIPVNNFSIMSGCFFVLNSGDNT